MKVAVHQPNLLPWIGYFHKIKNVDVFVILDDAQYSKGTVTKRVEIRTKEGGQYITVPIRKSGLLTKINEIEIANEIEWQSKILNIIKCNYQKAENFFTYYETLEMILYEQDWKLLSELNIRLIKYVTDILKISTPILIVSELNGLDASLVATDRLIDITRNIGGDTYYSGLGSFKYLKENNFLNSGLKLEFQNFIHPVYHQTFPGFVRGLSILDYLMHMVKPDVLPQLWSEKKE